MQIGNNVLDLLVFHDLAVPGHIAPSLDDHFRHPFIIGRGAAGQKLVGEDAFHARTVQGLGGIWVVTDRAGALVERFSMNLLRGKRFLLRLFLARASDHGQSGGEAGGAGEFFHWNRQAAIIRANSFRAWHYPMGIEVKSIQAKPSLKDGMRILIERTWPRRVVKSKAQVDLWLPEVAYSLQLAKWFRAHPDHVTTLRKRYFAELGRPEALEALERIYSTAATKKMVTLLHAGKSGENSAAMMIKSLIDGRRKPPTGSGPARAAAASGVRSAAKGRKQ